MNAKSKCSINNNISKSEIIKKSSSLNNIQQNNNLLNHNIKNKTKRLNKSFQTTTKSDSILASTHKKPLLNNLNINQILNKQLITVQQKPVVPKNMISSKPSETIISKKLENEDILKKKETELNSFSFIMPQTYSVQQRLEKRNNYNNCYADTQCNENDSMDWETINEPSNIVDKVNDLRKTTYSYEPMEWTPDTIMHSDLINNCLVVDTNILLSDLKSITIIIDKYLPDYNGYLTIVLPWRVLQELDCIKKNENALGYRAREATRWLLEMLSNNHPRLKGQPMTTNNNSTNADDSILKCAMSVKERVNCVTLITDDKILSIKSEINGIPVKNSAWLQHLVSVKNSSKSEIFQGSA
uniref:Transcriptional protein swt1 n=1 Tax=Sipha flava TaxID=143950 RepID=A0A2S2QKY5_9HEMI